MVNKVYRDGKVCISILHPPGEDETSGELASERWLPSHTIASIMLSVISMLNDPNLSSPANVEASVMYRDRRSEFNARCSLLVDAAKSLVPAHVKIPHPETNEQERQRAMLKHSAMNDAEFGMDSAPIDDSLSGSDLDHGEFGGDDDLTVEGEPSDEVKPPRKKKSKDKSTNEEVIGKISASKTPKEKGNSKNNEKTPKKEPRKRELVETEDDDTETESVSSALDAKELENLLQPDTEFKQWKRQWLNLAIWKSNGKGWATTKASPTSTNKKSKCLFSASDVSILTYNVLRHTTAEGSQRAVEQLKLLRDSNATYMVLNDVSPSFLQQIGEVPSFSGFYSVYAHHLTAENTSTRADSDALVKGANTLVISKTRIIQAQILPLPSRTERNIIRVECEGTSTCSVVIIAAHLDDSPRDVKLRVQQLVQLNKATENFTHASHIEIYAGDLGLSLGTKEHKVISSSLTDAWTAVHPGEPGLTYDPESNKMTKVLSSSAQPTRRDRILFKSEQPISLSPTHCEILGTTKLNHKYKGASVWPSDHFAVLASFTGLEESATSKKASKCVIS